MSTQRLIKNALVVMLALIPVAVGQQTNCKYGATGWVLCGGTVHNAGGDYVEVGQQTKKPQTKVRIDWMTLGVHLPRIGECFQVVDDHEGGSELSQIACPAEPPKVEIVTDSAEEGTVSSEPQNQSIKPPDTTPAVPGWLPALSPPCTRWDERAKAFVGMGHGCIVTEDGRQSTKPTPSVEIERGEDGNYFIKPPIDVPVIQRDRDSKEIDYGVDCGGWSIGSTSGCEYLYERQKWTCADKSRILLTAEDGSKHCIKFPSK